MNNPSWGLLGPEKLVSERRTRTLGLGAAVRAFNDLAVPGMGNVFFGKQLLLATIGIAIAEKLRDAGRSSKNIETANAVEALACWLAFNNNGWKGDTRLRGGMKMRGKNDLAFDTVKRSSFYVTQPMRMVTVQPLLALGLVESDSERFNAYRISQTGRDLLETVCDAFGESYYSNNIYQHLIGWAMGDEGGVKSSLRLRSAISPTEPLPLNACLVLRGSLIRGDNEQVVRRRSILSWVEFLQNDKPKSISWSVKPAELSEKHWEDLHAGALFFAVRDAALTLLDSVEEYIGSLEDARLDLRKSMPRQLINISKKLKVHATEYLKKNHDPTPGMQARMFCQECLDEENVIENLVKRDGQVLRLIEEGVVPGPAFSGTPGEANDEESDPEDKGLHATSKSNNYLPNGISERVSNLFLFNLDIQGKLGKWLEVAQ